MAIFRLLAVAMSYSQHRSRGGMWPGSNDPFSLSASGTYVANSAAVMSPARVVGLPVAREAVAPVLLPLGVRGCAYRLVCLQARAEAAADRCGRRDEPGENNQVAVAEPSVEIAAHHTGVEDEERPRQVHSVEGDITDDHAGHQCHDR